MSRRQIISATGRIEVAVTLGALRATLTHLCQGIGDQRDERCDEQYVGQAHKDEPRKVKGQRLYSVVLMM